MIFPRRERIIYTRFDSKVSICHPAAECMAWMTGGGGYWNNKPRGFAEEQVRLQIEAGHHECSARRFCHALTVGGCTDAEALGIILERDCGHLGTGFDVIDVLDIPQDQWFRDAWRRSQNGGPVGIDVRVAKRIQAARIKGALQKKQIEYKHGLWWPRLRRADDPAALKQIWPRGIDADI